MRYKIKIEGLDCANCASELEESLIDKFDLEYVDVDFMNQTIIIEIEEKDIDRCIDLVSHFEEVKVISYESFKNNMVTLKIEGLDCASCASELEEELNKIDGIESNVDYMNMKVYLRYSSNDSYIKACDTINNFEECKIIENKNIKEETLFSIHKFDIYRIILSIIIFIPSFILYLKGSSQVTLVISYVLSITSYLIVAYPVLINTIKNVSKGIIFDENFLMTLASIGAMVLGIINNGEGFSEGVMVMILYSIGELLQSIAVGKSRNSIKSLMELKSEYANLINGDDLKIVKVEELSVGDLIIVKVGEKFPVDSIITDGESSLDMKSLNGEAMPKDVKIGDEVLSGSINLSKVLTAKVIRSYNDSAVKKILDLVENSTSKKSKNEKFITKFAKYYTPIVAILALVLASIIPTIISLSSSFNYEIYREWIYKALNFLVISCPCALVISVPLSYFLGIGYAARKGILVKGSTSLDELTSAKIIAFDKTGTLTEGVFEIVNYSSEECLQVASSIEKYSKHPIAKAFDSVNSIKEAADIKEVIGKGLIGKIDNKIALVGSASLLDDYNINFERIESVSTVIYVAYENKYLGYIEIDDKIKPDALDAIESLKSNGINKTIILSGDNIKRVNYIKDKLNIDIAKASLLPQEKCDEANKIKEEGKFIYVGDGVNDAPVMTIADCSVSMGKIGSDAAIEASDIVLIKDDLNSIVDAMKIAKKTRRIVFENIIASLSVKFLVMILDLIWGYIFIGSNFPMIASIFADVGIMLLCVLNAMRLMKK